LKKEIKRVCLITTNHISTNPRLVKEAIALDEAGFDVSIIFSQHTEQYAEEDFRILKQHPNWKYDLVNWTGKTYSSKSKRAFTGILQKFARASGINRNSKFLFRIILNRNYFFQLQAARAARADLYIAHNAGALAVAAEAAKRIGAEYAFDAEDFHRGEAVDILYFRAVKFIEDLFLPGAMYVSAASPLISREYRLLYPQVKITTVLNVFSRPKEHDELPSKTNHPLKLFWFSQTVGTDRGIQDIIQALKLIESRRIQLHIYGAISEMVSKEFENLIGSLTFQYTPVLFHQPVSPDRLLEIAAMFDIGFASEPGFCTNNKIALSNKIFTYLVGGNAIMFSDTPAQELFYTEHPDIGFLYKSGDSKFLSECLLKYDDDRELLLQHKIKSKLLYRDVYNWEKEKEIFLRNIRSEIPERKEPLLTIGHGV